MSSQLSYRLHGREQRPKTLRKHYRDELDTGQVKASAKEPRACSTSRLVMGRSQFPACASLLQAKFASRHRRPKHALSDGLDPYRIIFIGRYDQCTCVFVGYRCRIKLDLLRSS
jgi:hypothetical protein